MTTDSRQLPATDAAEILSRYRRPVVPALREAVAKLHPWPRRMAAFTFGWVERDGAPRANGANGGDVGGKGLRPALVLLSARAAGADAEVAVPGAVAVELVHAFSLVHDDIMDGDERRRHRETAWKAYGIGPAVLAGDALLALAMATLATVPGPGTVAAMERLSETLVELVHGQAEDIEFEGRPWRGPDAVTVADYLAMAEAKTGSLLGCAAAVGTLLGGGTATRAEAMARMGRRLGPAFQIADDLLAVRGDPFVTGKPVGGDLRLGKKTLPVLAALGSGGAAADRLAGVLAGPSPHAAAFPLFRRLVEEAGGCAAAEEMAESHLGLALAELDAAAPAGSPARDDLRALFRYLVRRTR